MPSRIVREGINTSARINALSPMAELLYRRLMNVADDYGRFYASPTTLRAHCWPTCPERFTDADVSQWISECLATDNPLIIIYEAGGVRYLEIQQFGQQTRTRSKFPDPKDSKLLSVCVANAQPSRISESNFVFRISESKAEPESQPEPHRESREFPVSPEELEAAWDRHLNVSRSHQEPKNLVFQKILNMNGGFNVARFRENHPVWCEYWERHGWNSFGSVTFLGWIEAGMPAPPPEAAKDKKRKSWRDE